MCSTVYTENPAASWSIQNLPLHAFFRIEVEIAYIDSSTDAEDVKEAVRDFFNHGLELELRVSLIKRLFRGNRKVFVPLEETWARNYSRRPTIKSSGSPVESTGKQWRTVATTTLASAIQRRTFGGLIEEKFAGGATNKGTLRSPVQRNRSSILTSQEKISLGMIILRGQCVVRLLRRQHEEKASKRPHMKHGREQIRTPKLAVEHP